MYDHTILSNLIFLLLNIQYLCSQEIPIESIYYYYCESQIDRGINWDNNTSLSSARWQHIRHPLSEIDTTRSLFDVSCYLGGYNNRLGNTY